MRIVRNKKTRKYSSSTSGLDLSVSPPTTVATSQGIQVIWVTTVQRARLSARAFVGTHRMALPGARIHTTYKHMHVCMCAQAHSICVCPHVGWKTMRDVMWTISIKHSTHAQWNTGTHVPKPSACITTEPNTARVMCSKDNDVFRSHLLYPFCAAQRFAGAYIFDGHVSDGHNLEVWGGRIMHADDKRVGLSNWGQCGSFGQPETAPMRLCTMSRKWKQMPAVGNCDALSVLSRAGRHISKAH